tara:strand:- start:2288 stop:2776 length:489 start_codon:yes stop_codon:yes gene_type:complete
MMKNNRIENEHDITKRMLNTIRKGVNRLNENEEITIDDKEVDDDGAIENETEIEIDDVEGENNELDSPEAKEEASKISEMVNPLINVTSFKIYEDSGNVVLSGNFQNTDIEWQFSKNDGLFINAENVNLTDNVKEMLDKLSAYYKNWQNDWASKIGEYTKNN